MVKVDLQRVEQDARRKFNEDGLTYLFMGLLLAMVGFSFLDTRFGWLGGLGALLLFPVELIRKRITYPRVGYVKFEAPAGLVRGILGFATAAVLVLAIVAFTASRYTPIVIGVVFGLSMYFGASMAGVRWRDWAAIGLMLVSSIAATFWFDDWHLATAVQMWVTAPLLMMMGTADLLQFLRKYPMAAEPNR